MLERFADLAPMNFAHKLSLVQAEVHRARGEVLQAMQAYEQASQGARENGYLSEAGLAHALAAEFFQDLGLHQAALHNAEQAVQAWRSWGAHALVGSLGRRLPDLLEPSDLSWQSSSDAGKVHTTITQPITPIQLDMESIISASQMLSAETDLEQLLTKMITLVMANSGAEEAVLLLRQGEDWFVQARGDITAEKHDILLNQPFDPADSEADFIPEHIFNYCLRTREVVVMGDAQQDHRFAEDRMIQTHNIKSIACIPALHQGELKAMLYLENRQMPDVFTLERVEILKHLSSQFGVSVENALLYDNLAQAEAKYRTVADFTYDWEYWANMDGTLNYVSPSCERISGYSVQDFIDKPSLFREIIVPQDHKIWDRHYHDSRRELKGRDIQFRIQRRDGEIRWIEHACQPVTDNTGLFIGFRASNRDITSRKQAEEAVRESERKLRQNESVLRGLAGRLIFAQEEERSRLARELHDDLAQRLAVVAIDTGRLELQLMDRPAPVRQTLGEIKNGIVRISQDVHSLSRQLHPSILDDLGLIKAVESECAGFSKREGIEVVFNHENIPRVIPKDVSLSLYRIIQEGLRNISKHACAQHTSVCLQGIDHDVLLSVQDDGIGFDRAEVKENPGLGFSSMRERARLIHGEFSIKSQPEKGTVITVRAPLTREGE